MGKRQPYRCPFPGCDKSGKFSAVKQHYRAVHDPHVIDLDLEAMVQRGMAIQAAATPGMAAPSIAAALAGQRSFRRGMLFGLMLGISITLSLTYGLLTACQYRLCPTSVSHLIKGE